MKKKEALELSLEMWRWLEENPNQEKDDYLRIILNLNDDNYPRSGCFLCEYVKRLNGTMDCELCPIEWIYKNGSKVKTDLDNMPCVLNNTIFDGWEDAKTIKTKKKYAGMIADLIENELNKIKGE